MYSAQEKSVIQRYLNDSDIKSVENLVKKELQQRYSYTERLAIENNPALYQQTLEHFRPIFEALVEAREKIEKEVNQIQDILNQSISRADFHILKGFSAVTDEELEGLRKVREQTNALSDELYKLTHEDFENKTLEVNRWQEKLLNDENTTAEQREIIAQITAEKLTKIEKEKNEKIQKETEKQQQKLQDLTQSTAQLEYGLTHSAFEKQLNDIELWKDAQLEKSKTAEETAAIIANAAAKEADAFQREMDRIQGRIESAQDKLFRLTHSQQEYDLRQAQKEYDQYIKDGVPKELARQVYEATVADIERRAREDKGKSYAKSKGSGSSGGVQMIDFTNQQNFGSGNFGGVQILDFTKLTQPQTDWATVDAKQLAFETLQQKNQQLADSVKNVIDAQNNLTVSTNYTAQNLNHAANSFEYIEGDRVVRAFHQTAQEMIDAEKKLANATTQNADDLEAKNFYLQNLPNYTQGVIESMMSGHVRKLENNFVADAGYSADISNFTRSLTANGLSNEQAYSYLERIYSDVQQLQSTTIQASSAQQGQSSVNVSPNINVDLGGAYVFDNDMKQKSTDDVKNEIVSAVTEAFQQAKNTSNYGYGN